MTVDELKRVLEKHAPLGYSHEMKEMLSCHDNSGLLIDAGSEIKGVMFSLDFLPEAVIQAENHGCNCLVTHHPAIYYPISDIRPDNVAGAGLVKAIRAGFSVFSMHLNLDAAKEGIDYHLAELFGGKTEDIIFKTENGAGIGRVTAFKDITLGGIAKIYSEKTRSKRVKIYGEENRPIKRLASFCGAGLDDRALVLAKQNGCDCVLSSDIRHHILLNAKFLGISVIDVTHYSGEFYGFKKFFDKIKEEIEVKAFIFEDDALI